MSIVKPSLQGSPIENIKSLIAYKKLQIEALEKKLNHARSYYEGLKEVLDILEKLGKEKPNE